MRLKILENDFRPLQRLIFYVMKRLSGGQIPGTVSVLSYRRELFGEHMAPYIRDTMLGAREWSLGEIELFAAFVSRLNECQY